MPIRSPRVLVEIETITRNLDDNPDAIDTAPNFTVDGTVASIFVKMKKAVANYLGLEPVAWNDSRLLGVFGGNGLNKGSYYERRLGGYKVESYTLISKSRFILQEEFYDRTNDTYVERQGRFRTMTIGLPKGASVHEFKTFLSGTNNWENIAAFVTPNGRKIDIYDPAVN